MYGLVLAFAGMAAAAPSFAVTDGELDGEAHPQVGLMVAYDENFQPLWRCSGTLIGPTLFLTAGHCTYGATHVEIWFQADVTREAAPAYPQYDAGTVSGTPHTHPDYVDSAFFLYDLGVVVLEDPVYLAEYGQLPTENQLDAYGRGNKLTFTSVGYGLQKSFPDAASWKNSALRLRMVAHPKLIQINVPGSTGDFSLLLSNNARTGGTCFGDSGGPNFIGDSLVIAGVTSYGKNGTCAGTGGV
jgi:V8-like Glu-specific endopeptidase